jgi:hypothetical protein
MQHQEFQKSLLFYYKIVSAFDYVANDHHLNPKFVQNSQKQIRFYSRKATISEIVGVAFN